MRRGFMRRRRNPDAADRTIARLGVPPRHARTAKIAAGLLLLGVGAYFAPEVYDRMTYGPKTKGDRDAPANDYLHVESAQLAKAAGVPVDVYSLARTLRSEAGRRSQAERIAVAWAVRNHAKRLGKTITATVTGGTKGGGYYGSQNLGGRYVSTRYAPLKADLDLATAIMGGSVGDNTGGAERFFAPKAQDKLVALARPGYTKTAAMVRAQWEKEGWRVHGIPGVDESDFVVAGRNLAGIEGLGLLS